MPKLSTLMYLGVSVLTASMGVMAPQFAHAAPATASNLAATEQTLLAANPNLDKKALTLGLRAYSNLRAQGKDPQQVLTIVDYTKPSNDKRLWVINMKDATVKYNTLVAQGKNTGITDATRFSNAPRSLESSIGVFLTGDTYNGEHGDSLRLIGLDKGFNSNAESRAVVMHSAWYVSQQFAKEHGRVGNSWGCLALSKKMEPKVVNTIKDGSVILSYFPNQQWENSSPYLKSTLA